MKAAVYRRPGAPVDVVEIIDVPPPGEPAPGHLIVQVHRAPIHFGDLLLSDGPEDGFAPRALGTEGMGVVRQVGPGVTDFAPGDRVAFFPSPGSWRELVDVPARWATPVPDEVSDDVASLMLVNTVTARDIMRAVEEVRAQAGNDGPLVVSAAASAVSRIVITEAISRGLDVIPVVRSQSASQTVAAYFPHLTSVATADDTWRSKLRSVIAGRPVPAIVDAHGGPFVRQVLPFLSPGGTLVVFGDLEQTSTGLETFELLVNEYRLRGVSIARWLTRPDAVRAGDLRAAADYATRAPQLFQVAGVFDLDRVTEAVDAVRQPGKRGTPVLSMPA